MSDAPSSKSSGDGDKQGNVGKDPDKVPAPPFLEFSLPDGRKEIFGSKEELTTKLAAAYKEIADAKVLKEKADKLDTILKLGKDAVRDGNASAERELYRHMGFDDDYISKQLMPANDDEDYEEDDTGNEDDKKKGGKVPSVKQIADAVLKQLEGKLGPAHFSDDMLEKLGRIAELATESSRITGRAAVATVNELVANDEVASKFLKYLSDGQRQAVLSHATSTVSDKINSGKNLTSQDIEKVRNATRTFLVSVYGTPDSVERMNRTNVPAQRNQVIDVSQGTGLEHLTDGEFDTKAKEMLSKKQDANSATSLMNLLVMQAEKQRRGRKDAVAV